MKKLDGEELYETYFGVKVYCCCKCEMLVKFCHFSQHKCPFTTERGQVVIAVFLFKSDLGATKVNNGIHYFDEQKGNNLDVSHKSI